MPEHWFKALEHTPFMLAVGRNVHMNTQRVFEAILIAVITAVGTGYTVTVRLEERDAVRAKQVDSLVMEVRDLNKELVHAKVTMGDRWTGSQQREYEREVSKRFREHEARGHWISNGKPPSAPHNSD